MTARPPLSSRTTAYSSTSSGATSLFSSSHRSSGDTTAMTSPNLESPRSPKKAWLHGTGKMEQMLTVLETAEEPSSRPSTMMAVEDQSMGGGSRRPSATVMRGPSVRDRASAWEGSSTPTKQAGTSLSTPMDTRTPSGQVRRPLPTPTQQDSLSVTSSTAPLRVNKRPSPSPSAIGGPSTPTPMRRVPVPATAPVQRTMHGTIYDEPDTMTSLSARKGSPPLKRGKGSAKKMIQQWENLPADGSPTRSGGRRLPSTAISGALQPSKRIYSKEYLDTKPLPVPSATPLPTSNYYSPTKRYSSPSAQPVTPSRAHRPSPLKHLQTPTHALSAYRSTSPTSPSQYSLSTSPSSGKIKGKSPLKDMLNVFGGGIKDMGRKMKSKSRDKFGRGRDSMGASSREDLHFWEEPRNDRVGTSGLPGGIVFNDRMGDEEMVVRRSDTAAVRSSAVVYLVPTPCSSVAPWGSWLTSFATLSNTHLSITYCPVFQGPNSGNSTPRRILSGTNPLTAGCPSVPFSAIPLPAPDQEPDVELNMKDCVEVRSLRREEIKGRGIPPAPEGIGTEVLELVYSDGGKRYIGVEGVGGRLGWVSAIWDVLLACQQAQPPHLPPPSPVTSSIKATTLDRKLPQHVSPLGSFAYPPQEPPPELAAFRNRIASLEAKTQVSISEAPNSSAPPVQKVGDTWLAASVLASSEVDMQTPASGALSVANLRDSVQRMFDADPPPLTFEQLPQHHDQLNQDQGLAHLPLPTRRENEDLDIDPMERVKAWQQPDHTTQHLSIFRLARGTIPPTEIGEPNMKTETVLSFDPNDLNPSRSASQVRRQTTIQAHKRGLSRSERKMGLSGIEEVSDSASNEYGYKPPTHVSHVTFPKPTMGGQRIDQVQTTQYRALPMSPRMQPVTEEGSTLGGSSRSHRSTTSRSADSVDIRTPQTVQESVTTLGSSMDHTVLAKLEDHSSEHGKIERQMDGVQGDLQRVIGTLTGLVAGAGSDRTATKGLDDKLDSVALDVKAIENALNLNSLATKGPPSLMGEEAIDEKVPDVHRKLDAIAKLCEELLSRPAAVAVGVGASAGISTMPSDKTVVPGVRTAAAAPHAPGGSVPMQKKGSLGLEVNATEEKEAGAEVAAIMADLTGGSTKASPRVVGLQVLHNVTGQSSSPDNVSEKKPDLPDDTRKQVGEVLNLVKELKDARALQTQQTTDIARYLSELNGWLEKFVVNSTKELTGLNTRLTSLVGPEETPGEATDPSAPHPPIGLPDLVADMHAMVSEQKRRAESEGMVGQRLDTLLQMMGAEKERHAGQQNTVDQVLGLLDRQRQDNELLLRALATDLTSEIRGERIRFVEAMQQATSVNVHLHVEEFKKLLETEVAKSMHELGQMREEKKALEQNISDLFALKAKHGPTSRHNTKKGGAPTTPASPAPGIGRGLPAPPAGRPH